MSLHQKAKDGTLKRSDLAQQASGYDIDEEDSAGFTPIAYAVQGGHIAAVKILHRNGASLTRKTKNGDSLLHLAVITKDNSLDIVEYLLDNGANPDEPSGKHPNDTPIMTAMRHQADAAVIEALKKAGASLDRENSAHETAKTIAAGLSDNKTKDKLLPEDQQGQGRPELANFIVSAVLLALAYLKAWEFLKDVITAAIKQLYEETKPSKETGKKPNIDNPKTPKDFEDLVKEIIRELGLEDLYPPNDPYIKDVADKGAEAVKNGELGDKTPEQIRDLCRCALYQPVLYCDDSGSMEAENRMASMTELVDHIAAIMNTFVPEDKGVHLRFINRPDVADNLNGTSLQRRMNFKPVGATPLGTSLESKILQPMVYNTINQKRIIERPYLIITITDGCPNEEDEQKFQNEIIQCSQIVKRGGYARDTVRFLVNQVGTDAGAKKFIDGLNAASSQPALQGLLHQTSDQLDKKYEQLRNNKKELDIWLMKTILPPLPSKRRP